jgi:hypothetical protein
MRRNWKKEFEALAEEIAACVLAEERAIRRGEKTETVFLGYLRLKLDSAAEKLGRPPVPAG